MREWNVDSSGRTHVVSVTLAPNGKRMIRVDGRLVAPPQSDDAIDYRFDLDGEQFHLHGSGDALELDRSAPIEAPTVPVVTMSDPARFVLHRVVVFMIGGIVLFVGAAAIGLVGWAIEVLQSGAAAELAGRSELWARVLENQQRISIVMRLCYFAEALVGAAAIVGAVLLMKRVSWAPLLLELVTWCVPGVYLLMVMAADPWMHRHVQLFPVLRREAIEPYDAFHYVTAVTLVVACVIAGILLMFLQRRRLEASQNGQSE